MLLEVLIEKACEFHIEYERDISNKYSEIKLITALKEIYKIDKEVAYELATEFNILIDWE